MTLHNQPDGTVSQTLFRRVKKDASLLLALLGLMWVLVGLGLIPGVHLLQYGIRPRTADGLVGILAAPLLHANARHLAANSVPFLVLGAIVLLGGRRLFWMVTGLITVLGGLGVWLVGGASTVHVGASGLIFGYLGFLLARGFYERSLSWSLVGFVLFIAYGGLLYGVLPGQPGVSWQSHFFGLLAGIATARLRSRTKALPGSEHAPLVE